MRRPVALLLMTSALLATSVQALPGAPLLSVADESLGFAAAQARLNRLAPWQLKAFGAEPRAQAERFVRDVLGLELMLVAEARAQKLDKKPSARDAQQVILARALEASLAASILETGKVPKPLIEKYFAEHRSEFSEPARISVWRIVVSSEARAREIIKACQGAGGVQRWRQIAREESIDRATHLRNGDLGFVRADGSTDFPQLRVNPRVYAALEPLPDGAILPAPLKLDENYAVLWRRGSVAASTANLEAEREKIATLLTRKRLSEERDTLLGQLKTTYLKAHNPLLLEVLDGKTFDAPPPVRPKPLPNPSEATPRFDPPKRADQGLR